MASTSLLSNQKSFKYEVFLSFRGEDTRKNFVDHLYHALTQQGIVTYRDDEEIRKGKRISEQLIRSIEDSKLYIIVLSKNYALSSWCLDELVKIIECQEMDEHTAYVVFYDVEPTEVRKQSRAVGEAFSKHKGEESAEKWRAALSAAADLAGWELKTTDDGHEAKFIQRIVKETSLELRFSSWSVDPNLIGMEKRVDDVLSSLEVDIGGVRMIGIKGMGGGGKTTLAKAVFDQIAYLYESSSFIADVREFTKVSGLKSLQKQVLSDVLNDPDINVNGFSDLKRMMKKKMCSRKVLLVLDDVNHIDQIEALAGDTNWFKQGSRVIITTRDEQVLLAHGVPKNLILNVNLLSDDEASCLFSRRAFGRVIPDHGFEMLSDQVLSYANGLPLTIKVLGSFLRGKDEHEWIDALKRLKEIPLKETLEILELSYKSLEEDYKEIFLEVACILKGWKKENAIIALESYGYYATNGLKVLEQRSLISVSSSGVLSMHDHIEEMGKNIARRFHPPYKRSRLWIKEEIEDILVEDKGTEATRSIRLCIDRPVLFMKGALQKMNKLRFLEVVREDRVSFEDSDDHYYKGICEDRFSLPNSLQCLLWDGYPFTCLPERFDANNLVYFKMHYCNIDQLWEGGERKVLKKLRFIDLSYCKLSTLDIGLIPNLERLNLDYCRNLAELRLPVKGSKLESLRIRYCQLKTLDLKHEQNIETLFVEDLPDLVDFHMPIQILHLKHLNLRGCGLDTLNLTRALNLEKLHIVNCDDMVELCMPSVGSLMLKDFVLQDSRSKLKTLDLIRAHSLEKLSLYGCHDMIELRMPVECFNLTQIHLQCSKLKTLDLSSTLILKKLTLQNCEELEEVHMPDEKVKLKYIKIHYSKLKTLDLARAQNIKKLDLYRCHELEYLNMPAEIIMLESLGIYYSRVRTLDLVGAQNIRTLNLFRCDVLEYLNMPAEILMLESIKICYSRVRALDLARAQNLETLTVKGCDYMLELRMPKFKLRSLIIHNSKIKTLDLAGAQNIKKLDLFKCDELECLNMPVEILMLESARICYSKLKILDLAGAQNIKKLDLYRCDELEYLNMPAEIFMLESAKICYSRVRTLDLARAQNLETLTVKGCDDMLKLHMPKFKLRSLIIHNSKFKTLDLAGAQNIKKLNLFRCDELECLNMPVEIPMLESVRICYSKLKTLDLAGAQNIQKLDLYRCDELECLNMPAEILMLESVKICYSGVRTLDLARAQNLKTLTIKGCDDMVMLHMPKFKLRSLIIHSSKLKTLDLARAQNIKKLDLYRCDELEYLNMPAETLLLESADICYSRVGTLDHAEAQNLQTLTIKNGNGMVELHMPVKSFKLRSLEIYNSKLKTLDLARAHDLGMLNVDRCMDLVQLRMPFQSLKLKDICLKYCKLKTLNLVGALNLKRLNLTKCKDLRTLYLGESPNLKRIDLKRCYNMVEIHAPIGCLNNHVHISSSGCARFNPFLVDQGSPMVLAELHLTTRSLGAECKLHPHSNLHKLSFECVYKDSLTRNFEKLVSVHLCTCINLASFLGSIYNLQNLRKLTLEGNILEVPKELEQLECLVELSLMSTDIVHLPESICLLRHLKVLRLQSCKLLEQLPNDLGRLECLEELHLTDCTSFRDIPNSILEMKCLKRFCYI